MCSRNRARLKRALAVRDGKCCFYCTMSFADLAEATIDHLIPKSVLPGWQLFNLVLACRPCNQAKADTLPQVFIRKVTDVRQRRDAARRRTAVVRHRPRVALAA